MTTPMIEKLARAISDAEGWLWSENERERAIEVAQAALLALAEPDEGMVSTGGTAVEDTIDRTQDSYGSYDIWDGETVARAAFKAMILNAAGREGE